MAWAALDYASTGGYAFVIVANKMDRDRWLRWLPSIASGRIAGPKFYPDSGGQISVETPATVMFDWDHLEVVGAHRSCRVFVDHFAIEQRYAAALRELHAYDQAPSAQPISGHTPPPPVEAVGPKMPSGSPREAK
jgi:hypothetical protein